jgi:hypothetical protein
MPTLHSVLNFLALVFAIVGGSWELLVKPRLTQLGYGRVLVPTNNGYCKKVPELAACESESLFSRHPGIPSHFLNRTHPSPTNGPDIPCVLHAFKSRTLDAGC